MHDTFGSMLTVAAALLAASWGVVSAAERIAPAEPNFELSSTSFEDGGMLPVRTAFKANAEFPFCFGENVSPQLSWAHPRVGVKSFAVTMYEIEVAAGTKVNKVVNLGSDIAYALATPDVRIIAPIPGKSAIGIEVPNQHRDFVMLGDILRAKAAREATHPLEVALGKDVHGRAQMVNLAAMPHLLIAGATGAGKSSLVNCFITSLLMRSSPDDVKLVLVDPKRVELSHYAEVPHLLSPVIVHPKRATEALQWLVREMELRYEMLATVGVRDIDGYEAGLREGTLRIPPGQEANYEHMPFILVVIDELADLMMVAPRDVEDATIIRSASSSITTRMNGMCS